MKLLFKKPAFKAAKARDNAPHYQHSEIGYNYRLSNICAGIGRGQMEVIDERVAQRRANFAFYEQELSGIEGIIFQPEAEGSFSNRWLSCIIVDPKLTRGITREDIRLALAAGNIGRKAALEIHNLQPVFAGAPYYGGNVAAKLFQDGLCLPSGSNLTEEELGRVVTCIKSCF